MTARGLALNETYSDLYFILHIKLLHLNSIIGHGALLTFRVPHV